MSIWQILYLSSLGGAAVFSVWYVLWHDREAMKKKQSAHKIGAMIGASIVAIMCLAVTALFLATFYLLHTAVWEWLGCVGGC